MARVKLGNIAPPATDRSRGSFLIIDGPYGPYAMAWPKKRKKAKRGYALYHELEFASIAIAVSDPEPIALQSAMDIAHDSEQVARDILMMATMGTFWQIIMPDGSELRPYRMEIPNVQLVLDQLTELEGSVIFNGPLGWVGLGPGSPGQVLTIAQSVLPAWMDTGSGGTTGVATALFDVPGSYIGANGWQKPFGAKYVDLIVCAGGGGGGSGRRGPFTTNCGGGAGGGGAGYTKTTFRAQDLPNSVDVTVGAGGPGGAAIAVNATNGQNGTTGGRSVFGPPGTGGTPGEPFVVATGGAGGAGGTTANTAASLGGAGGIGGTLGGLGHGSGNGAAGAGSTDFPRCMGGGGGGGHTANVALSRNGGNGGDLSVCPGYRDTGHIVTTAAGGVGATKTNAQNATHLGYDIVIPNGAGGAWTNADGTAGNGGTGAFYGGGGGGGGGSRDGILSGAGGNGGDGVVMIITRF